MNKQCDCKEADCPLCLLEAANARLLRVAREMDEMLEHMEDMSCVSGYYVDNAREALKEVEDLL